MGASHWLPAHHWGKETSVAQHHTGSPPRIAECRKKIRQCQKLSYDPLIASSPLPKMQNGREVGWEYAVGGRQWGVGDSYPSSHLLSLTPGPAVAYGSSHSTRVFDAGNWTLADRISKSPSSLGILLSGSGPCGFTSPSAQYCRLVVLRPSFFFSFLFYKTRMLPANKRHWHSAGYCPRGTW